MLIVNKKLLLQIDIPCRSPSWRRFLDIGPSTSELLAPVSVLVPPTSSGDVTEVFVSVISGFEQCLSILVVW